MEVETKGKEINSENTNVGDLKLGGNIVLSGFSLEPSEMIVIKKIVGHYAKKISERGPYKELKVRLKQSKKAQYFMHQINATADTEKGNLSGEGADKNLYTALSEALDKVYNQAEHKERTARQGIK